MGDAEPGVARSSRLRVLLDLIQPMDNLSGVIYGLLITGATIATAAGETHSVVELVLITIATVAVYWIAHGWADYAGDRAETNRSGRALLGRTMRRELPMFSACLPVLVLLLLVRGLGASIELSATAGLAIVALSLMAYGYRSARRAGMGWLGRILVTLLHGVLGAAIILVKVELH